MSYSILLPVLTPFFRGKVVLEGADRLPRSGAAILAANHQGTLDPQAIWYGVVSTTHRKMFVIAKASLRLSLGAFARWLGILFIHPRNKSVVLADAQKVLREGQLLLIFPEGGRNRQSATVLLRGKTGVARLALATGAPVIPIGVMSPVHFTPFPGPWSFLTSKPITLVIGEPLQFPPETDPGKERLDAVTREIMQAIGKASHRSYPY